MFIRYPDMEEINAEKITPTFPINFDNGESRFSKFSQARYSPRHQKCVIILGSIKIVFLSNIAIVGRVIAVKGVNKNRSKK